MVPICTNDLGVHFSVFSTFEFEVSRCYLDAIRPTATGFKQRTHLQDSGELRSLRTVLQFHMVCFDRLLAAESLFTT